MISIQEKYTKQLSNLNWENGFNPEVTKVELLAFFAELVAVKNLPALQQNFPSDNS